MKYLPRSSTPVVCIALAVFAAGCASTQTPATTNSAATPLGTVAEAKPADAKVTTEYEYVKVTGSLVPMKVPKNGGKPLPTAAPVTNMSAENFDSVVGKGLRDAPGKN